MFCEACGEELSDGKQPEAWIVFCPECFNKAFEEFINNAS